MIAEILCVGTELLLGDIVNTNAAYIAKELAVMGIDVYTQSVVGDNPARLKDSLAIAFSRADTVIMTGGLGPTYDDLTKETVAAYFGRQMQMHEPSLLQLTEYFKKRGTVMTENNKKQAMMPDGAVVFDNPWGTAPGLAVEGEGKIAILMPGPPQEMVPMFQASVVPYLMKFSGKTIVSHNVHMIGIGESALEAQLKESMLAHKNPTIAPYAKQGEVLLRVTAQAATKEEAEALIAPEVEKLCRDFPEYVYGVDVGDLQHAAVALLMKKGLTVATAESCTGGLISKRLTEVPGSSEVFGCGVCSYANEVKEQLLGVSHHTLETYGAVSPQTAAEMAAGIRRISGADIGISVTGIAGPGGGTEEKPVGLVYLGVNSDKLTEVVEFRTGGRRKDGREYIRYVSSSQG
ncbi:MAG: competence/damage-inducible protein A, partial [Christensenellaceae bacterium]|nr:competence/damage-inducible protein A [Christensenellaceae bacterium]